ncbi:MAG: radical SAM protein [Lachnospiraceae bacterium]|nr:radical SAM protein [Lachnospiraceae bacterium]
MKILSDQKLREGASYVLSQFALTYACEGKQLLYHTMTRQLWDLDRPMDGAIAASAIQGDEDLMTLMKGYFLVPEGKDECAFYEGVSRMLRIYHKPKGIMGYTILPTFACNARCVYCYEEGMKQVSMTPEIAEQTVQYILQTKGEGRIEIGWFGGEPLMGEATIDKICERLKEEGVEYGSSMITNASLLSEAVADKMAGPWKIRSVQVSMDGAEQDYIARKCYVRYHNTYQEVMAAINRLLSRGIAVSVRCNVDEENLQGVPKFLSDLSETITEKQKLQVYIAPLNAERMGENDVFIWEKALELEEQIRKAGFGTVPYHGGGIRLRIHHCMADKGSVVIAPDGSLYSCEHCPEEARFGNIYDGVTDAAAKEAFCRTDRTREKCRKCPFLPDCTSFATCPVWDTHCEETRRLKFKKSMEHMIRKKQAEEASEENLPVC